MTDRLADLHSVMHALGHPTRLKILERLLSEGELSSGALAEPFDVSASAISTHIRVLEDSGIVQRRFVRQRRMVTLRPGALHALAEWTKHLPETVVASTDSSMKTDDDLISENQPTDWIEQYAKETSVSIARSREELENALQRFGATAISVSQDANMVVVQFEAQGRRVILRRPLPDPDDPTFRRTPRGRPRRTKSGITAAYEADCRGRWRALVLAIKAKLASVEHGVETLDEAFLAHIVGPDGRRLAEQLPVAEHGSFDPSSTRPHRPSSQHSPDGS